MEFQPVLYATRRIAQVRAFMTVRPAIWDRFFACRFFTYCQRVRQIAVMGVFPAAISGLLLLAQGFFRSPHCFFQISQPLPFISQLLSSVICLPPFPGWPSQSIIWFFAVHQTVCAAHYPPPDVRQAATRLSRLINDIAPMR